MPTLHIDGDDLKKLLDGETIQHPVTGLRIQLDQDAIPQKAAAPKNELDYDNPLPPPETIDLTPRGMATPEGCARTAAALEAWNASAHTVANLATNLLAARQNGTVTAYDWEELEQAIQVRAAKQEEFLRAVAGVPPAK